MNADRKPFRVLFVCMGNICRSPAAEIVFRQRVRDAGLESEFEIDSAGTLGYHAGKGPDSRMAAVLSRRGYTITGASRPITARDLDNFDLVLVMDRGNLDDVCTLDPSGLHRDKIRLFMSYGDREGVTEVPDPYYGGQDGFEHVADLVESASDGLLLALRK